MKKHLLGGDTQKVFRGMLTLALGSGAGKLIALAAMPILTRLYTPEDFGALAVFTTLVALLVPIATLRYVIALPLPRHDGTAMNLLVLSLGLMTGLTALFTLVIAYLGEPLLTALSMEVLVPFWWLIALAIFGAAAYETLSMWATRKRAYKLIAQTNITQNAAGAGVKILLGLIALQPLGLLIGQVAAQSVGITRIMRNLREDLVANTRHIRLYRISLVARKYIAFPLWRVPSQFALIFSMQAPILFVAALYSAEIVGQFSLATAVIAAPAGLIGINTARAFYAEASALGRNRTAEIRAMFLSVIKRLAIASLIPMVILFLFGEVIFSLVFGADWAIAGSFSQALSIYIFFQFIHMPVGRVFDLLAGQRQYLALNLQRVGLTLLAPILSASLDLPALQFVWIYAIALSAHYAISILYALHFIDRSRKLVPSS